MSNCKTIAVCNQKGGVGKTTSRRMFKPKKRQNTPHTLRKIVRRNMPQTVLRAEQTVLLTKRFISLTSRDEKAWKQQSRIFQRRKTESGSLRKSGRRKP